ncbi:MAG: hypothetical protein QNJ63_15860 [Calothrix sp. MO_192.B10]|nr:hypothetical protein [Calothrix sp. MO_192.B10]
MASLYQSVQPRRSPKIIVASAPAFQAWEGSGRGIYSPQVCVLWDNMKMPKLEKALCNPAATVVLVGILTGA